MSLGSLEVESMEVNVLFDERSNEVVTVIVSFLEAELKVDASSSGSVPQLRSVQLVFVVIRSTSVAHSRANHILRCAARGDLGLDECGARVLLSGSLISSEVLVVNIRAESRGGGVGDRSKGRARGPSSRLHCNDKGTVSSHRVAHNRSGIRVNREEVSNEAG